MIIQDAELLQTATANMAALAQSSCQQLTERLAAEQNAVQTFITESLQQDHPTGEGGGYLQLTFHRCQEPAFRIDISLQFFLNDYKKIYCHVRNF
jgi:hypothetical protein